MFTKLRLTVLLVSLAVPFVPVAAQAAVAYDESLHGDISGNRLAPTQVTLSAGVNSIAGTMGTVIIDDFVTDQEYLRIDLPAGAQLTNIRLGAFESLDFTAFIGVQSGTTFSFDPDDAFSNIGNLLGWSHFGPGVDHEIGEDILPSIAAGPGAIGFTPPLTGASYTFWLQQTGDETHYQLDFVVTPEPATWVLMLGTAIASFALRRGSRR